MTRSLKIWSLIVLLISSILGIGQQNYCPEKMLLINKYKSKDYIGAKLYLDTVLTKCPEQNDNAYYWHVSGFINYDIYMKVDNRSPLSKSRPEAVKSFIKSWELDVNKEYSDHNLRAIEFLTYGYHNDAVLYLDTLHFDESNKYYEEFKILKKKVDPAYDFISKDIEYHNALASVLKEKYENNKVQYKEYLDRAIENYNFVLSLDPNNYSANYNLGIIYHNLGVDIILTELDIEADLEKVIIMEDLAINNFTKSLPYLKKVHNIKPTDKSIVRGIAAVYYSLNDMEKHVEYMDVLRGLETPPNKE